MITKDDIILQTMLTNHKLCKPGRYTIYYNMQLEVNGSMDKILEEGDNHGFYHQNVTAHGMLSGQH